MITMMITALLSGVPVALIYGHLIQRQIASAKESHEGLMALMREERNMINNRLAQISANLQNILGELQQKQK